MMTDKMPTLETLSYNHAVLDLRGYWQAIREGLPIPTFGQINKSGLPDRRAVRSLGSDKQVHVVNSPLSPEFYEEAHAVDRLIVMDIRRRASLDL